MKESKLGRTEGERENSHIAETGIGLGELWLCVLGDWVVLVQLSSPHSNLALPRPRTARAVLVRSDWMILLTLPPTPTHTSLCNIHTCVLTHTVVMSKLLLEYSVFMWYL